ncbi:MAG: AmmeMemoRadiSam system radical SAM enzyme [Chloroflexota bacterium]
MGAITRRDFLTLTGGLTAFTLGATVKILGKRWWEWTPTGISTAPPTEPPTPTSIEALYYTSFAREGSLNCQTCHESPEGWLPVSYCHTPHTGNFVRCNLCPHGCIIADGQRGTCRVRENRGGSLFSMVYGNPCAVHVDPIEKKPFYHFLPTIAAFSIATAGCNMRCLYCQNWTISQAPPEETENVNLSPGMVAQMALQYQAPVIAYTYSEPIIFYEYMLKTAQAAREAGLYNVVISAGFIHTKPLLDLCEVVDAIKIDLKGYDEDFYRQVCSAELKPVLDTIKTIYESKIHLEIVNLVVPTLNDRLDQLKALSHWIANELNPDIPLHFSRFQPQYKLANLPATPVETLERAREVAMNEGVRFVYIGNVPGHYGNNTFCPNCGRMIIARYGFGVQEYHLKAGACEYCNQPIPGVWWPDKPEGKPVEILPGPVDH